MPAPDDLGALARLTWAEARRRLQRAGADVREKHSGGASSLLLGDEVLHFPSGGGPALAWRWPDDPWLPGLRDPGSVLRQAPWRPAPPAALVRGAVERRLMYNPGRRAALLVRGAGGRRRAVLKLLRPDDARAAAGTLSAVAQSGLPDAVPMPTLLSAADRRGALLLDYVAGEPVTDWTPARVDAAVRVLVLVHATRIAGLPAWTPARDAAKVRRLLALLRDLHPRAATALEPSAAAICARLAEPYVGVASTIHRDYTVRHLLDAPDGALAVLDWDSCAMGAPEKDVATLAAGLSATGADVVSCYEAAGGRTLDRRLVESLVLAGRLARDVRRLLSGSRPPSYAAQLAAALEGRAESTA